MSDQHNEQPKNDEDQLNDTNEDNKILTLEDILNQQREIEEVNYWNACRKFDKMCTQSDNNYQNFVNIRKLLRCSMGQMKMFVPFLR